MWRVNGKQLWPELGTCTAICALFCWRSIKTVVQGTVAQNFVKVQWWWWLNSDFFLPLLKDNIFKKVPHFNCGIMQRVCNTGGSTGVTVMVMKLQISTRDLQNRLEKLKASLSTVWWSRSAATPENKRLKLLNKWIMEHGTGTYGTCLISLKCYCYDFKDFK